MRRKVPCPGFTLIEILVVISIISLLASLIMGSIVLAKKKTFDSLARAFIAGVDVQVHRYRLETGGYPGTECSEGENAFPALFEALWGERPPRGRGGPDAPYMTLRREEILVPEADGTYRRAFPDEIYNARVPKFIRDPWGSPYVYHENASRPFRIYMVRRDSVDVYSTGADRIDQTLLGKEGDDIGNW